MSINSTYGGLLPWQANQVWQEPLKATKDGVVFYITSDRRVVEGFLPLTAVEITNETDYLQAEFFFVDGDFVSNVRTFLC